MTQDPASPLGPPPRKAYVRRSARNVRRAYGTLFWLVIAIFGGWAVLDAFSWPSLTIDQQLLTIGFGLIALIALIVHQFVEHPYRRELRLARRGLVAKGQIAAVGCRRNRRASPMIAYTFCRADGTTAEGDCTLPRRFLLETLSVGMAIDVLYDATKPHVHKPVLGLEYVEFGPTPPGKKGG